MNRLMLYRHRKERRRFLTALWIMVLLSHLAVFVVGGLRGFDVGFENALGTVEQEMKKNHEEKADARRNVRGSKALPSAGRLTF